MAVNINNVLQQQQTLTVASYNMHGYNQGFTTIRDLSASVSPDIFLLQEHWATPSNLSKFNIFQDYFVFGSSAMTTSVETGIIRGRPFGGVMILIKNYLRNNTQTVYAADRCVIIKVLNLVIINVYLPCVRTVDRLLILADVLNDISCHISGFTNCVYLLGGDFNCSVDKTDAAANMINSFLIDNQIVARCDVSVGKNAEYTYINESSNCRSLIDYFFISDDRKVVNFDVVDDGSNLSDHLPIIVTVNCDFAISSAFCDKDSTGNGEAVQSYLRWDHADLITYYNLTGMHLQALLYELNIIENDSACTSSDSCDNIKLAINTIYGRLVDTLRNCANFTVPQRKKNSFINSGGTKSWIA